MGGNVLREYPEGGESIGGDGRAGVVWETLVALFGWGRLVGVGAYEGLGGARGGKRYLEVVV